MSQPIPLLSDADMQALTPEAAESGLGTLQTRLGNLPLTDLAIEARVAGLVARTTLRQTFVNTGTEPLEATYIFPLPDRAAVVGFRLEIGERTIVGELMERGAAREQYAEALEQGYRAAMAEEDRPDVFTMQVGNLMPGDVALVVLDLVGPLVCSAGEATYRFPLVVAPRYIPGTPLAGDQAGQGTRRDTTFVPDASRLSPPVLLPGFPNPVHLSLSVELDPAGLPFGPIRSSLHAIVQEEQGGRLRVAVHPGERLNRDFVLRIGLAPAALASSLLVTPDEAGAAGGTFALTVVPPALPAEVVRPRDVVFALDRSGSMAGWKMIAARRAIATMVDTLTARDRFTVYAFDSVVERPPEFPQSGLAVATDSQRFHATEWLAGIEARGGTEMLEPLSRGVALLAGRDTERDRILVLVTDGQVGNEDQILAALGPRVGQIRVFTVGIDTAVNAGFLNRLASVGRGACELVESEVRLQEAMDSIHRMIGVPVLTDLRFVPDGLAVEAESIVPARMPDVFAEVPLVVMGRYTGPGEGSLRLQGRLGDGSLWESTVRAISVSNDALTKSWARGRVRELEDRYAIGVDDGERLAEAITATSLDFGVLCRFTAYVAVDTAEAVNVGGQVHHVVQAVELPDRWVPTAAAYCLALDDIPTSVHERPVLCRRLQPATDRVAPAPAASLSPDECRQLAKRLLTHLRRAKGGDAAVLTDCLTEWADDLDDLAVGLADNGLAADEQDRLDGLIEQIEAIDEFDGDVSVLWRQLVELLERIVRDLGPASMTKREFWK